jgi:hypothetical protein
MKAEQQRIEKELVTFENKLWGIEEPDTTITEEDTMEEKRAMRSTARRPKAKNTEKKTVPTEKNEKKTSVRTSRQSSTTSSKSTSSGQTLSVRRQRR